MSQAKSEAQVHSPEDVREIVMQGNDAAAALKRIARDERIKDYVQNERFVHDALLGAALRFIGGESLEVCLNAAGTLNRSGHAVTIDYMGESTRDERMASEATGEFLRVIKAISEHGLDSSVSLDLSHVGLVVDSELALANALKLADAAREMGLEVMVSMEGSERTEEVLVLYRRLSERFENVGITLQAHLRRTPSDLHQMLQLPGKVRLVKGAFEEPEEVALPRGKQLDNIYCSLVEQAIFAGQPVSVATHDPDGIERTHRYIEGSAADAEHVEFEMLKGVETERLERMRGLGYRTRVYLPYGLEWYLYLCHRLAEHPPNIYQAVSDAVSDSYSS